MAEIQAGIVAIRQAVVADRKKLVIHTDSQFLINCVTKWMQGWKVMAVNIRVPLLTSNCVSS